MTKASPQVPVAAIAGALFCVILIYLAVQIRSGNDPAIGGGQQTAATQVPRRVIVRRVIIRRIVEDAAPAAGQGPSAGTTTAASIAGAAPVAGAPAPAAAPPPAAPAVVSRGS